MDEEDTLSQSEKEYRGKRLTRRPWVSPLPPYQSRHPYAWHMTGVATPTPSLGPYAKSWALSVHSRLFAPAPDSVSGEP